MCDDKTIKKTNCPMEGYIFFYERDCITPTVDLPQMSTTDNTDSVRTMHEIMQEDIDGEISSTYNAIFSQPHMANIPPDPSEEAFLRDFHEEESVIMTTHEQDDFQTTENVQLRHSSRIAAIHRQQPIHSTKRVSKKLADIARSCDVQNFNEQKIISIIKPHYAGLLNEDCCVYCKAYRFRDESKNNCCKQGKVHISSPRIPPKPINDLFETANKDIVQWNNAFAFTSLGCTQHILPGYNPTFKIQGKVYHRIGSLLPEEGQLPKYAQIYIFDTENELQNRLQNKNSNLDKDILQNIQQALHRFNPYIKSFKSAVELLNIHNDVKIVLHHKKSLKPSEAHNRTYNLPQSSEVAALVHGESAGDRDLILSVRDGSKQRVSIYHRSYDPLQYVILFPYGDDGWQLDMKRKDKCSKLTLLDFYSYRLQVRKDYHNTLMKGGRLTQVYTVDAWCKVESSRFHWVKNNQKQIRADKYSGLIDAINENDLQNAGKRIILPPTIYGTPRFYQECFYDAMALVMHFGKPDYFITVTTNPNWIEIKDSLFQGQSTQDRPDLGVRVFKIKLDSIIDDLM